MKNTDVACPIKPDAPVITIDPAEVDYGLITIGCDNEERITIRNDGNQTLIVNNVTQMVTQPPDIIMEFGSLPLPPWELLPTQEIDFLVSYITFLYARQDVQLFSVYV